MKCTLTLRITSLVCMTAFATLAQQEQWLQYRTSNEPRSYRWVQVSTNAPAGVALPTLRNGAVFGSWTNGFDGVRWLCLDRPGRSGPCDRLFADINGNGRLDDEKPITAARRDSNMAYFDPVKFVFKGEDGPVSYHLVLRMYQYENQRSELLIGSGAWYEGQVVINGTKRRLQLSDNTVNGLFNDVGDEPTACDRVALTDGRAVSRYLGRYLEVDNQLLSIEVARDGAFVKIAKAANVPMATLRLPESISSFDAMGRNGQFVRKPDKGAVTLPAGMYRVNGWSIDRKDARGAPWTLSGSGFSRGADFTVGPETATSLAIGEPIRAVLRATESSSSVSFNLKLLGSLGETLQIRQGSEQGRAPRLIVSSQTGSFRSTNSFEFG